MSEFWYLDRRGRVLGSINAYSYSEAHAILLHLGVGYHKLTKWKPRLRRGGGGGPNRRGGSADRTGVV